MNRFRWLAVGVFLAGAAAGWAVLCVVHTEPWRFLLAVIPIYTGYFYAQIFWNAW